VVIEDYLQMMMIFFGKPKDFKKKLEYETGFFADASRVALFLAIYIWGTIIFYLDELTATVNLVKSIINFICMGIFPFMKTPLFEIPPPKPGYSFEDIYMVRWLFWFIVLFFFYAIFIIAIHFAVWDRKKSSLNAKSNYKSKRRPPINY
jgi:magnesium-transporting ATPase (P-type)